MFGGVADRTYPLLDKGRYCAVVIGDTAWFLCYAGNDKDWIQIKIDNSKKL